MHRTLIVSLIALLLGGCAAAPGKPYAVIDGTDWDRTDPYAYPVTIAKIDGKDYLRLDRRALDPGRHRLEFVTGRSSKVRRYRETRSVDIVLAPCTHYAFYAKHAERFSEDWELKTLRVERIESCGR